MMKNRSIFILLAFVASSFLVSGCAFGPSKALIIEDLSRELDEDFKKDLFKVNWLRKMGTYKSTDAESGEVRLLVYFDTRVEFLADYNMSRWSALGFEALVNVVGAGARGVDGVKADGNKKGDVLLIHGTLLYSRIDEEWSHRVSNVSQAVTADEAEGGVLKSQYNATKGLLTEISSMSEKALRTKNAESIEKIHSMVRITRNRLAKRLDGTKRKELILATGHVIGTYYTLGQALAENLTVAKIPCRIQQTEGSAENCRMIHHGYVDLAVSQNDIAFYAHTGTNMFEGKPLADITALCSWYPEPVQVFVLSDSGINSLSSLKGKVIVIGPGASGSNVNARQVLKAYGFTKADMSNISEAPAAAGFEMLGTGKAEAVFLTEAFPARVLKTVAKNKAVQLLQLSDDVISKLKKSYPFFVPFTIPANHYKGFRKDIKTVAVTSTLVANSNLSEGKVYKILSAQYSNLERFIKTHPKGAAISRRHALDGLSIPQHPGAIRFFKENK